MDATDYIKMIVALLFVLALMAGLTLILKKLGLQGKTLSTGKKRLKIVEILPLDARRRLMLIQRDDVQHLVITNGTSETLVETNIEAPKEDHEESA